MRSSQKQLEKWVINSEVPPTRKVRRKTKSKINFNKIATIKAVSVYE